MTTKQNTSSKNPPTTEATLPCFAQQHTWFSFLKTSRKCRVRDGGWEGKSTWDVRGLKQLTPNGNLSSLIERWTRNSWKAKESVPRSGEFMFGERKSALEIGSRGAKGTPEEGSENSLSWRLSKKLRNDRHLFSYEVPLTAQKKGQLKVDLFIFKKEGCVEIIELKRSGKKKPNTPLMALTESICYALQSICCWDKLSCEAEKHLNFTPGTLSCVHLVLAAPDYWDCCNTNNNGISREQIMGLVSVVKGVEQTLHDLGCKISLTLSLADIQENELQFITIDGSPKPPKWSVTHR